MNYHGAFTALVTPFNADASQIDFGRLDEAVDRQAVGGVAGVVPCGTTGESPTLSDVEHREVIVRTIERARTAGLSVIAGAGSNDTAYAVEMHCHAKEAGADAALHVCPYYNKPSQEGLYRHFTTLADSCDLPIVLYNIPGRTGVALTVETLVRLAAHPNVQAVKDATGTLQTANHVAIETDLAILSGDDPITLPLMSIGGTGVISILSNLLPGSVAALCRAAEAGDYAEARAVHQRIVPLAEALLTLDTNPVPLKAALAILGWDSGAVRLPLTPGSDAVRKKLQPLLAAHDLRAPQPVG